MPKTRNRAPLISFRTNGSGSHTSYLLICFAISIFQNVDSGLCVAMGRAQGMDLLTQEVCDVKSEEQRFTCKGNSVTPVKDSGLCVTASGNC